MSSIDLLSGVRSLKRSPGVSLAAVLSLAFGIAASCAVFSVVDALLLQPLPFADSASLVFATETAGPDHALNAVSGPDLADWQARSKSFEELAGFRGTAVTLTRLQSPERIDAAAVQPGVFAALRVPPAQGRTLVAADDLPGAPRVAVVSHRFWRTRLSGDPAVLEHTLTLDGQPSRIVGVMPDGFRFPLDGPEPQLWLQPRAVQFGGMLNERALFFFQVLGRLRPGATVEGARAELAAITADISAHNPESHVLRGVLAVPLREQLVGADRGSLFLLLGAVGLLLVIACTNVGSLLARLHRRQELAIRAALGASRWQLLRQLGIESAILVGAAGIAGVAGCALSLDAVGSLLPAQIPRLRPLAIDGPVLLFALAACALSAVVFGSGPALIFSGTEANEALRTTSGGSPRGQRLRAALVIGEVALATALLISATLLVRSLRNAHNLDAGVSTAGLQVMDLTLPDQADPDTALPRFAQSLAERVAAIPGVTAAGIASPLPVGGRFIGRTVAPRDRAEPNPPQSSLSSLGPGALSLLGVRLLRGREFTAQDRAGAAQVVIVNRSLARLLWPDRDPIGQRIGLGPGDTESREVVGLAADVRSALDAPAGPQIYAPYAQVPWPFLTLVVRSGLGQAALESSLKREISAINSDLLAGAPRKLDDVLAGTVARRRFAALVLTTFAAAALLLALGGISGTLAYVVAQRTRELGIRAALGATRGNVLTLVLGQGLRLAGAGVAFGAALAGAFSRVLASQLFGIGATDPLTYAGIGAVLLAMGAAASLVPAWHATRVDPMQTRARNELLRRGASRGTRRSRDDDGGTRQIGPRHHPGGRGGGHRRRMIPAPGVPARRSGATRRSANAIRASRTPLFRWWSRTVGGTVAIDRPVEMAGRAGRRRAR
jgi:predicted permease